MKEDFYIGYLPQMPAPLARVMKRSVAVIFTAAVAVAVLLWIGQKPFAASFFEFGTVRDFEGSIEAHGVPFLLVERPASETGVLPVFERLPLVGEGKRGVDVRAFEGRRVRLRGTIIERDGRRMIEVAAGPLAPLDDVSPEHAAPPEENLGAMTLRGEIVDSKCYLGVMNPGESKPHRDCAVRCISGGIPPLFVVHDAAGRRSELWLLSPTGAPVNRAILDFVAEPVAVTGTVTRRGDQLFFRIDPAAIKRIN